MGATIRQISNATGLIIAGGMRDVDNGTGLSATDVYSGILHELKDWLEGEEDLGRILTEELVSFFGGEVKWEDRAEPAAAPSSSAGPDDED